MLPTMEPMQPGVSSTMQAQTPDPAVMQRIKEMLRQRQMQNSLPQGFVAGPNGEIQKAPQRGVFEGPLPGPVTPGMPKLPRPPSRMLPKTPSLEKAPLPQRAAIEELLKKMQEERQLQRTLLPKRGAPRRPDFQLL